MQLSAGTPWKALPPPILSFWVFFNWNQALEKKIHFYWKQDMRRVFACVAIFFLQFAPGDSLFFSRTWTMKVSNKGSSHSSGKDAGGQGSSLNPWWGQWDGLCWSFCPGWDFTGSCFTKPQGGNSKAGNWVSCKMGFTVLSDLWGLAPCAAGRSLPPRSALGWGAPSITLIWLLYKSNF